jgi:acyl-coenzyme A synthetase/AMP-(fatty) acid ligase
VRAIDGEPIDLVALYERLVDRLPRHCLPAFIIERSDDFPKTSNGKIRKVELAAEVDVARTGGAWTSPAAVSRRTRTSSA